MQSKRDQVQAHTFTMSRLTAGMLMADPDAADNPLGRTTRGISMGLIITVLLAAVAVVWGLISPGGKTSWKSSNSLIVNKDTSARYLYIGDRLRPVRNVASARLIGGNKLAVATVGSASLRGTPVGLPVGIPGAPDSVPAAADLDEGHWLVCSTVLPAVKDGSPSKPTALTSVVVGSTAPNNGLGAAKGIVVQGPDKAMYLVWQGSRLKLDKTSGATLSLGYGSVTPRPVSAAFLDALVPGPVLATPDVPGRGSVGPKLTGVPSRVGQLFKVGVPGSPPQYYVLQKAGLVPVTDTAAALIQGDPRTRAKAYGGATATIPALGTDTLKQYLAPGNENRAPDSAGLPSTPPHAADIPQDTSTCAGVEPGHSGARVTTQLVPTLSLGPVSQVSPQDVVRACLAVDSVIVRPGHAALVRALGAGGTNVGDTTYLVSDTGAKYRVPTTNALTALGYSAGQVVSIPSQLLAMLPSGPDLDPAAASGAAAVRTSPPGCGKSSSAVTLGGHNTAAPTGDAQGVLTSATGAGGH